MRTQPVEQVPRTGDGLGWGGFLGWALAGAALGFTWLTALSIGIFLLLPALILIVVVARRFGAGGHLLGIVAGIGLVCLFIAALHAGEPGCHTSDDGSRTTCSSFDPAPWWVVGSVALLASTGGFVVARTAER